VKDGRHIGFWLESQKERDHLEVLDVGRRIILRMDLGEREDAVVRDGLISFRIATSGGKMQK
jgi:hypothetical protein